MPIAPSTQIHVGDWPVTVRRLRGARRYTLRVRTAQRDVVLSMPWRGSLTAAQAFADRHTDWIEDRIGGLADTVALVEGAVLPLRGVPHRVLRRDGRRAEVIADEADGAPALTVQARPEHLARRLTDWLRRQALADLDDAVRRHAGVLGVEAKKIRVTDTASRWGSCSSRGVLAFSWRLVLAPPAVLDYVAAHEVAHLKQMNHSPAFWALCHRLCPGSADARAWLRKHGAELHRYG